MKKADSQIIYQKREFYKPNDAGLGFVFACLVPQLFGALIALVLQIAGVPTDGLGVALFSCLIGPVCYCLYYILFNKKSNINWKSAGQINFRLKWWHILLPVGLGVLCVFGFNNFITLTDKLLEIIGYSALDSFGIPMDNFGWFVLNVVILAVLPAIFEELIFRGIILNGIKEMEETKAVFFSAFLFALFHGNASQTIYQFILGVVLAYVVVLTKNLLSAMVLHFTNNFVVLLINYIQRGTAQEVINFTPTYIAVSIVVAIVTAGVIALVVWLFKRRKKGEAEIDKTALAQQKLLERKVSRDVFLNKFLWIGMLFALTIWIVDFIY